MMKERTRVTLDLGPAYYKVLCELEKATEASCKAEVLRRALRDYYEAVIGKENITAELMPIFVKKN